MLLLLVLILVVGLTMNALDLVGRSSPCLITYPYSPPPFSNLSIINENIQVYDIDDGNASSSSLNYLALQAETAVLRLHIPVEALSSKGTTSRYDVAVTNGFVSSSVNHAAAVEFHKMGAAVKVRFPIRWGELSTWDIKVNVEYAWLS